MPGLDLEGISRSVVKLRAKVPDHAFTAGILGSRRTGNRLMPFASHRPMPRACCSRWLIMPTRNFWGMSPKGAARRAGLKGGYACHGSSPS